MRVMSDARNLATSTPSEPEPRRSARVSRRRSAVRRALGIAATSATLATLALGLGFLAFVAMVQRTDTAPVRADAIVAMTGGSQRIGEAMALLAEGYGERLLISGVNESTRPEEIARLVPGKRDLFACCVDLDYLARDTIGNAAQTRLWAQAHGFGSLIVVTSNYHMPRTLLELESALPRVERIPFAVEPAFLDTRAWWRSATTARLLASEYLKFVAVLLRTGFERRHESPGGRHEAEAPLPELGSRGENGL